MASPYRINVPAYEGPLDLLLDLIRKQEMDIHNIPIAKITEQYLDYLHQIEKFDIDVSADFIYMAATLIHIKSKMLLPVDPLLAGEESQDPRDDLVHRLLEHEKFKNAAQLLYQKQQVEAHVWSHPDKSLYGTDETQGELVVSLVDLVKTFQQILERKKEIPKFELRHDSVSIAQMMDRLRLRLIATDEPVSLIAFFENCESKNAMIVALLAVLEMVRMQAVEMVQSQLFACASTKCSKLSLPGPTPWPKLRSNICDPRENRESDSRGKRASDPRGERGSDNDAPGNAGNSRSGDSDR
jgi:segregation and condensation protein A